MKPMSLLGKVFFACLLCVFASTAFAIEPIPRESGFSGFVNAGAAVLSVESNMIAGNDFGDVGKETISSIFSSPDSESDVIPVLNAEVAYTFASTRTQVFIGNRLEDFLRFDLATLVGVRQELPDESILGAAFVFSGIPTEVWADPYVQNQPRQKTDRDSRGVRLNYAKILGTGLEFQYTYRKIDLDREISGLTQLVPGSVPGVTLTIAQAQQLDRNGNRHDVELLYDYDINDEHKLVPSFIYSRYDLDGDAMSEDRFQIQLTHRYLGERFIFVTNLLYAHSEYDETNPIYLKKQDEDTFGGNFTAFYRRLFGVDGLRLMGMVLGTKGNSNIDFYESSVVGGMLSVFYKF